MSMLAELIAAGTPAPIRTDYATRWNADKCCVDVQCPRCFTWYRKTHNANCPYCCIDLAYVVVPAPAQPAPATVATPELVEQPVTSCYESTPEQVATVEQVQTVEQVAAGIDHYKSVCQAWDFEFDEPYVAPNEELSAETLALIAADTTVRTLDAPLALDMPPVWMQPEHATEAEPVATYPGQCDDCPGRSHALCCWNTEDYYMVASGKYELTCQRKNSLAVDCTCGDRVNRGRKAGRACKHMMAHNTAPKTSEAA